MSFIYLNIFEFVSKVFVLKYCLWLRNSHDEAKKVCFLYTCIQDVLSHILIFRIINKRLFNSIAARFQRVFPPSV